MFYKLFFSQISFAQKFISPDVDEVFNKMVDPNVIACWVLFANG